MKQIPSIIRIIGVSVVIRARENTEDDMPHPWDVVITSSDVGLKQLECDLAFKINSSVFVQRLSLVKILYVYVKHPMMVVIPVLYMKLGNKSNHQVALQHSYV